MREIKKDIIPSIVSFIVGLFVVWLFTCASMPGENVKSKLILASQAMLNCILALGLGIGVISAAGIKVNPLSIQILPFFLFGIGTVYPIW